MITLSTADRVEGAYSSAHDGLALLNAIVTVNRIVEVYGPAVNVEPAGMNEKAQLVMRSILEAVESDLEPLLLTTFVADDRGRDNGEDEAPLVAE